MTFRAPVDEFAFLFSRVIGLDDLTRHDAFSEISEDLVSAILTECGRLCDDKLAPLNRVGDEHPATLENGIVRTPPGFADGYQAIADGGWTGVTGDPEYGGMGLPTSVSTAVNDMMAGACLSLQLNPMMTQGQIEALEHHASDAIKSVYLPKLIEGTWHGTMNLTEPQAGSDVGALRTKAEPKQDGSYSITGQKIFITWADNDFTENTCHLVLARLPDGAPGTKGISLFIVPKLIPDADGTPGARNSLRVVSLEHKLGIHGSPTAVMEFDGAQGWLIGEEHGGMAAMFTMMNNARLGVGAQGIGVAEAAFQHALAYANDRKQGRVGGTGTIVEHADVKRMLATMKADIFAARSVALACAHSLDMARATGSSEWNARAAFLTPIAKAFGTDTGIHVSEIGIQVHGGMGYIEETGAAQFYRDARVTAIYEGTNGIQALDLVGRKMSDGGAAALALLDDLAQKIEVGKETLPELATAIAAAIAELRDAVQSLATSDMKRDRLGVAYPFLTAFARVLGGYSHFAAALSGDASRIKLARFYVQRLLPEYASQLAHVRAGGSDLEDLTADDLAA
jgi:alkylation response protein AidB-like acyl-CoA dehydrogenase